MKNQNPKKAKQPKTSPVSKKKHLWWVLAAIIAGAVAGVLFWGTKNTSHVEKTVSAVGVPAPSVAEKDLLVGRWVRTDSNGGYTLEIRGASDNGKLEASYFNPNPINVGNAAWHNKDGSPSIVVELRDVNYPGSTYTLSFSKTNDQLVGTYYQAVESVNYDVIFARLP